MYWSSLKLSKFIFYMQLHNLFDVNMDIKSSLQLSINICLHSRYFKFRISEGKCSHDRLLRYIPFYFSVLCQEESITPNESGKKRGRAVINSYTIILTILPSYHRITFMLKYLKRLFGHILSSWVCSSTHWDLCSEIPRTPREDTCTIYPKFTTCLWWKGLLEFLLDCTVTNFALSGVDPTL